MSQSYTFNAIAEIKSPYKEKFGIPRQPGLATSVTSRVCLNTDLNAAEMVRGLENCSHIWLLFIFSECVDKGWSPTVRPPRLGGNKRTGVLSTRSPFRPNPIGLSVVELLEINQEKGRVELIISGADLLDGTPIVDIKPYLPYSDAIADAENTMANKIEQLAQPVEFSEQALADINQATSTLQQPLKQQIIELLRCDPRPAYKKDDPEKTYGVRLHHLDIHFRIDSQAIYVDSITQASE